MLLRSIPSAVCYCAQTCDSGFRSDLVLVPLRRRRRTNQLGFLMEREEIKGLSHKNRILCCSNNQSDDGFDERKDDLSTHGISNTIVGVLGGGQLGRMLCQAASQMGIKVIVLDPLENCPASMLSFRHMVGSYDQSDMVQEFARRCGVLTVEIEHVDAVALEKLEQQGIDCQPKASTIRIIQINNLESATKAGDLLGYPLMIKCKRLAYDGRGNAIAHSKEDLSSAISVLGGYENGLYAEKWAQFVKELAVIVARGRDGSISCYPVVETIHKDNICHIVNAPADVSWNIRKLATNVAEKAVSSLEGAGVFAVELFLTRDNQILLNEVAPRPHNSGHHTIEACYTSQFEQHLRAILGLPLGDPSMKVPAAIMYNLLGEEEGELGFHLAHQLMGSALKIPGAAVHWYDKPAMRKLRKMGHITIVGPSMPIVKARLDLMLSGKSLGVTPSVAIIMGSDSDLRVMRSAAEVLEAFGVDFEVTIVSAHRTPERMFSFASSAEGRGVQVIIAGMVASLTDLPVIGVPVKTTSLNGVDSVLSILQMPKGVPVATVAIDNSTNAALLAVRILARSNSDLRKRLTQYREDMKDTVLRKAEKLEEDGSFCWGS
ncbi:phosphoribosylaminoimidazole carboxylase, chloroplastic isoform X1 [Cinnamomum micranthum f. kanehirae]|uniref:phosphoribosylaminoimidazole carboxylase n=1 Tax=Cinnamomum micranthum f. kanehirae TaxID=337451 RepID=A0A443P3I4_9MAGN|nr:phosphoribosylaminoimidazole carboxylase, chloroplastic isoform X1 [Cinnamomum micranthum f. kanehirae]